jgi:hypothetical protein
MSTRIHSNSAALRLLACFGFFAATAALPLLYAVGPASAAPCYPNDPDDQNPGNLCLTYPASFSTTFDTLPQWSPLPNRPINQPPFIQGVGTEAYYGFRVSTTQPGRVVGTTSGYWTNIEAVNGSTTIKDSNGQTIAIP